MSKTNPRKLDPKTRISYLDLLWTSIAELHSKDEVKNFFKDLLSESEAIMLARRILIAQYLLADKGYDEIVKEIKTSYSTIAAVHKWLISGFGGYEKAFKNFQTAMNKKLPRVGRESMSYSFDWLKKKYPLHFLLFNLLSKK